MTGQVIGNYRIIDRLGGGGMGKVYRAVDMMVEREVAMKALLPEIARQPETMERFRTEAITLAKLNHPSIAQLYTFFREGNDFYMVMEFVPGETLESRIQREPVPWREAFSIAASVLEAIHFAHSQGILHRDLKPANIMITNDGRVKVMDFGIAQALGRAKLTREGRVVGTVEYLAPERIRGAAPDPRSDLYSMGIVLYEMITGRLPFGGESEYEIMMAQLNEAPAKPGGWAADLPAEAEQVVMKALEKDPENRYEDANRFAAALRASVRGDEKATRLLSATPGVAAPAAVTAKWRPASWTWIAVGAAALLVVAMVAMVLSRNREDPWKQAQAAPTAAATPVSAPVTPPPLVVDTTPIPVAVPASPEPVPAKPVSDPSPKLVEGKTLAARQRQLIREALGEAGPVGLNGLIAALRIRGSLDAPEIAHAVTSRGVGFQMTAAARATLYDAGANTELLRLVEENYHAPEPPKVVAAVVPPPAAAPAPAVPARRGVASLSEVREIYVDKTPGELDDYLRAELGEQLGSRMKVAGSASHADAILKVSIEEMKGGKLSRAGRVFGLSDKTRVHASVVDTTSRRVLWEERAGERQIVTGLFQGDSLRKVAKRIVRSMQDELR